MSGFHDAGPAVLLFTEDMQAAVEEITSYHGAHITQKLSTNLLIAHFPPGFGMANLKKCGTNVDPSRLDKHSQLMFEAWQANQLKKASSIAGSAPSSTTESIKWDTPGYQAPGKDDPTST